MPRLPPMLSFVAPSGTGKTTLLVGVIQALSERGYRVAVLKHDAHRIELDKPGKDTWRFRQAGAWRALIVGETQLAVFSGVDGATTVAGVSDAYLGDADLVLTEGFRHSGLPMVRVHRAVVHDPSWRAPSAPIAWVSDSALQREVPVLPLQRHDLVADFVESTLLGPARARRATTLVMPMGRGADPARVAAAAARLGPACEGGVVVVHAAGVRPPPEVRAIADIQAAVGPLGALLTGLAASQTPDVVFVGARHRDRPVSALRALIAAGSPRADVVVPLRDGLSEPTFALYGHRCLAAMHAAILSGEPKMDGWWGEVRIQRVEGVASIWR